MLVKNICSFWFWWLICQIWLYFLQFHFFLAQQQQPPPPQQQAGNAGSIRHSSVNSGVSGPLHQHQPFQPGVTSQNNSVPSNGQCWKLFGFNCISCFKKLLSFFINIYVKKIVHSFKYPLNQNKTKRLYFELSEYFCVRYGRIILDFEADRRLFLQLIH